MPVQETPVCLLEFPISQENAGEVQGQGRLQLIVDDMMCQ